MRHLRFAAVIAIGLSALAANAAITSAGGESVRFTAKAPAMSIHGKGSKLTVSEADGSVKVVVPLKTLSTGIDLRDEHMQKAFESDQYPDAELTVSRSALNLEGSGDVDGTLKLHGTSKPVRVHYESSKDGDTFSVKGSFNVNMPSFNIKPPSKFGLEVKPDVYVSVSFKAKDN